MIYACGCAEDWSAIGECELAEVSVRVVNSSHVRADVRAAGPVCSVATAALANLAAPALALVGRRICAPRRDVVLCALICSITWRPFVSGWARKLRYTKTLRGDRLQIGGDWTASLSAFSIATAAIAHCLTPRQAPSAAAKPAARALLAEPSSAEPPPTHPSSNPPAPHGPGPSNPAQPRAPTESGPSNPRPNLHHPTSRARPTPADPPAPHEPGPSNRPNLHRPTNPGHPTPPTRRPPTSAARPPPAQISTTQRTRPIHPRRTTLTDGTPPIEPPPIHGCGSTAADPPGVPAFCVNDHPISAAR